MLADIQSPKGKIVATMYSLLGSSLSFLFPFLTNCPAKKNSMKNSEKFTDTVSSAFFGTYSFYINSP